MTPLQCKTKLNELAQKALKGKGIGCTIALQALATFSTSIGGAINRIPTEQLGSIDVDLGEFRQELEETALDMQLDGGPEVATIGWALYGLSRSLQGRFPPAR